MTRRPASTELLDRLHSLMHAQGRHLQAAVSAEGGGLGPMEMRCLRYLAQHEGATQSDLVQHSGRDKAQIARLIKALGERGLVQSRPHPEDRRSQVLSVTVEGMALRRQMQAHLARFETHLTADLSASEKAELLGLLGRLEARASGL